MAVKMMYISNDELQIYPIEIKINDWNFWTLNVMKQPTKIPNPKFVKPTNKKTFFIKFGD